MAQELTINNKPPLSGWPMLIFWWAMILFALHASTHMVGAGDTWVAMACGRHFLNHGVNTVEPFSANSHKPGPTEQEVKTWPKWAQWVTEKVGLETVKFWHPTGWVNQNWLTHVLFYWLTHESPFADAETFDKPIEGQNISYNSLVYWKYALYIITIIVVYYTGRVLGVNSALSAVFSCFALFVGRTFFDIRPAGFSNMLTAVLLFIFVLAVYKNYLYIWLLVPTTVLWCNLHGGYIYVFVVLIPFIGLHLLLLLPKKISMCLCYIAGWLLLCALAVKFRLHEYLAYIKFSYDGLLFFVLILAGASIILTSLKNIKTGLFHSYHIISTFIVFIAASNMFYPAGIDRLMGQQIFNAYVTDSRLAFFVAFIGFLITVVMLGAFKSRLKTISFKCWLHTVAAAVVAFVAMIIANPFRLTNLTHVFVATVGEDAKIWKTVNEWHPAFEWNNPVGDETPFLIMYIIAWVLLALWVVCLAMKPKYGGAKQDRTKTAIAHDLPQYNWPMLDLPLMMIASLTIYMTVGSRRFIPVAAIAACPIMAMFVDTSVRMIAALVNLKRTNKAVLPAFPVKLQRYLTAVALAIVVFLTFWWGYWYKTIYLNPWPDSDYLTSEFMRMTASHVKPFKACQFLRDNNIRGKVFNYWTEGGFIAYGQIPDPNTGKTPLQLFMDGRAQAAYNTDAYHHWMYIMSGGDVAYRVKQAGRNLTDSDYKEVGEWLDKKLQEENVEVVFMPRGQFNSELVKGLDAIPEHWRLIFMNDLQRIYVDTRTQQGLKLYLGLFDGRTKFPDKFSESMTKGYSLLRLQDKNMTKPGYDYVVQAFMQSSSQMAIIELMQAAGRYQDFRSQTVDIFS
ncbi:MAG: hypothetical protein PHF37_11120, partial [Phycisphaerae bacterium]|nr:hypothetical protein [Phycisphaerae bacterium]